MKKSVVVFYLGKYDEGVVIHRCFTSDGVEFDSWKIRKFSAEFENGLIGRIIVEELDQCCVEKFDYKYLSEHVAGGKTHLDGTKALDEKDFEDSLTATVVISKENKKFNFIGSSRKSNLDTTASHFEIGAHLKAYLSGKD